MYLWCVERHHTIHKMYVRKMSIITRAVHPQLTLNRGCIFSNTDDPTSPTTHQSHHNANAIQHRHIQPHRKSPNLPSVYRLLCLPPTAAIVSIMAFICGQESHYMMPHHHSPPRMPISTPTRHYLLGKLHIVFGSSTKRRIGSSSPYHHRQSVLDRMLLNPPSMLTEKRLFSKLTTRDGCPGFTGRIFFAANRVIA